MGFVPTSAACSVVLVSVPSPLLLDTASGARIDLRAPQASTIQLDDIAGALSKICRFGAQISRFYSVAQHAVLVSTLVREQGRPDLALAALHHDSHEAFVCDLPTPVKRRLGFTDPASDYGVLCQQLDHAIATAFDYQPPTAPTDQAAIKYADRQALLAEATLLLHDRGAGVRQALTDQGVDLDSLEPLPVVRESELLSPSEALDAFTATHHAFTETE